MSKQEYLELLRYYLSSLPETERNDLLRDYEVHFSIGMQNGKSEAEIALELGNPMEIAREAIGPHFTAPAEPKPPQQDPARTVGVTIMLFFVHLVTIPLGVAFWSLFVAACAAAAALLFSPAGFLLEWQLYGDYFPTKLFASLGMAGIGLMLLAAIPALYRQWKSATVDYGKWVANTWKGRS